MSTLRITLPAAMFLASLLSCNNEKANNDQQGNVVTSVSATEPVSLHGNETIQLGSLNNDFVRSITQTFKAPPGKTSIITARKGLKVTVNPSLLEKEDGSPVDGEITLQIVELTTSEELFKSNAATLSNGRLLVSGGSYFVGMQCGGQSLHLKDKRTIRMEFPKIKQDDMELFYGGRDSAGNMNWLEAEQPLVFNTTEKYTAYNPPFPYNTNETPIKRKYHLFKSVNTVVKFVDKELPLYEIAERLQRKGIDKNIDTVYIPWPRLVNRTAEGYGWRFEDSMVKRYRLISCKDLEGEKDSIAKRKEIKEMEDEANRKYNIEWAKRNEDNSFTRQLQNYYAPSEVTQLGWINCDRFYDNPQTDVPLDIPYTLNNPSIQYFLVYKSFNGLMSGILAKNVQQQYVLTQLPAGQTVTMIAFTKNNGQLLQCKQDFVVLGDNKRVKLDFTPISAEEMTRLFGKNVRI